MNSVGRCGLTNREAHACVARKIAHRITVACTVFASIAIDTQDSRSLVQPRAFKGVSPAHHASLLHVFVFGLVHQRLTPRGESLAVVGGIRPPLVVSSQQGESQAGDTSRRPKRDVFDGAWRAAEVCWKWRSPL